MLWKKIEGMYRHGIKYDNSLRSKAAGGIAGYKKHIFYPGGKTAYRRADAIISGQYQSEYDQEALCKQVEIIHDLFASRTVTPYFYGNWDFKSKELVRK